jgi:hypothetical protein
MVSRDDNYSCLQKYSKLVRIVIVFLIFGTVLSLGVIIGYFSRSTTSCSQVCNGICVGPGIPCKAIEDATDDVTEKIIAMMSAANIQNNLE